LNADGAGVRAGCTRSAGRGKKSPNFEKQNVDLTVAGEEGEVYKRIQGKRGS